MRKALNARACALSAALVVALFAAGCGPLEGVQASSDSAQSWTPAVRGLRLRVQSAAPTYDDAASFSLEVVFENVGDTPVGILPPVIRRRYRALGSGRATYIPYPGPPIYPWRGAFALGPGEVRSVTVVGMRDGDGIWALEPGAYELSVRYIVDESVAGPSVPIEARRELGRAKIWVGQLESPAVTVVFRPRA